MQGITFWLNFSLKRDHCVILLNTHAQHNSSMIKQVTGAASKEDPGRTHTCSPTTHNSTSLSECTHTPEKNSIEKEKEQHPMRNQLTVCVRVCHFPNTFEV